MVAVDGRLFPLFETLNRANLDWLVVELLDGLELGLEPEASEDELDLTRQNIRSRFEAQVVPDHLSEGDGQKAEPRREISGDDQIVWASRYVQDRLSRAVDDLAHAAENLDHLLAEGKELARGRADAEVTFVVVTEGERSSKVSRAGLASARKGLFALRNAIEAWSSQVRQGGQA